MTEKLNIAPQIVGELYFIDRFGYRFTPKKIFFGVRTETDKEGDAFTRNFTTLYGSCLHPVIKANGERLCIPGYSGLCCKYDAVKGVIYDFYEE